VTCVIEEFRESAEPAYIRAVVYVERESQKGIVIGRDGHTIRDIGAAARERIETLMGARVYLDLRVKVMPGWRRRDPALKRLGYLS
jgi:GTP-binding protein Era